MGQKDHNGPCPRVSADAMFCSCNSKKTNQVLPTENFSFLLLARDTIILQHLIIHFLQLLALKVVAVASDQR